MQRISVPKNFGLIADNIYRSALPNQSQLIYLSQVYGLNAVLDLTEIERPLVAKTCLKLKIKYFKVSMIDSEINHQSIDRAIELIQSNHPLLIHCWAGRHRTGLIAALIQKKLGFPNSKIFSDLFDFEFGDPNKHKKYFDFLLEQIC